MSVATATNEPTLGQYLRGHRLRFGPLPGMNAWMRLTIVGDVLFRAEVVPSDSLPKTAGRESHVLWYAPDSKIRSEMEALCYRVLGGSARPVHLRRSVTFHFDGDGEFRGWGVAL